jgi:signal transduction histidine kinase
MPVEAAGVWLDQAGRPTRRSWVVSGERAIDERLVERLVAEPCLSASQQRLGPSSLTLVPLLRGDQRLGSIALLTWRGLGESELTGLKLLARQVAAELAARSADLEDSSAMSRFIALVTHELRSPLTALRGNVQLAGMAARKGDLERAVSRIDAALKGVDGITALVQNLQDISQLERGKFELHLMPAEVAPTIESAARRAERMAEVDHTVIEIDTERSLVALDAVRLEQAFFNLLLNALQYSGGAPVRVTLTTGDERAVVSIADRGIGIPRDELARVFEPYFRGDLAARTHAKGLGLGLAISRATIERHGGRVDVQSALGQGSTFTVQLPLFAPA